VALPPQTPSRSLLNQCPQGEQMTNMINCQKRGIGFEEVQEIFSHPYYLDPALGFARTVPGNRLGGGAVVHRHFRSA
jgi:hypothetical protein